MQIGYARVSTDDQKLELQRDALRRAGCDKILDEKVSGSGARLAQRDELLHAAFFRQLLQPASHAAEVVCFAVAVHHAALLLPLVITTNKE